MKAVIVLAIMIPLSYAQSIPHIDFATDSDVYVPGQTIHINGIIAMPHDGAITITVMAPNGNIVAIGQVIPDGRDWHYSVPAEFSEPGTYQITAYYALSQDADKMAQATFVYSTAVEGVVMVSDTDYVISFTGDAMLSAYTDSYESLLYIEFITPQSSGVMRIPEGLVQGDLLAVSGGVVTSLPDGSFAYSTDGTTLVVTADSVSVPEFGAMTMVILGASAAVPIIIGRLHQ